MHLAILTPSFLPIYNGMTFATMQHASMLTELGHRVTVVAACPIDHRASVEASLYERGISFLAVDIAGSGLPSRPIVGNVEGFIESISTLGVKLLLVEGRYFWGYHLITLMKRKGLHLALISHGSADSRFKLSIFSAAKWAAYSLYHWRYERSILPMIDAVALLSAHEDNERFRDAKLFRRYGISPVIIGNTSVESVVRGVQKIARSLGKIRIAVVGEMSPTKNQLACIELARGNQAISFIKFYFQAENEYSLLVEKMARKSALTNFQYIIGLNREEIIRSLGDIDLILCLSKTEAQPLAIVDGLACGVPFLSTPVGCMPSMRGGLVSKVSGMRRIIERLSSDPSALEDLAHEARLFFEKMHSESAVKPALAALISAAMIYKSGDARAEGALNV